VTAVIVDTAIQQSRDDKESRREAQKQAVKGKMQVIRNLFVEFDEDGNSVLTRTEIENAPDIVKAQLAEVADSEDIVELFDLLDQDHTAELTIEEFCSGLTWLLTTDESKEFIRLRKKLEHLFNSQATLHSRVDALENSVRLVGTEVKAVGANVDTRMATLESSMQQMQETLGGILHKVKKAKDCKGATIKSPGTPAHRREQDAGSRDVADIS